ncbi:hypothetical protein [Methanobrevibacter sp.]
MANEILAAILSFFIPGLGQAYAGDIKKGVIFFVIAVVLALITTFVIQGIVMTIVNLAFSIYAAYDAYQMAK